MSLDRFIQTGFESILSLEEVLVFCRGEGMSLHAFCDAFATHVATAYLVGEIDFDYGDEAMNSLFGMMASEPFFKETQSTIPKMAYAIYEAFDAGEYFHPGDAQNDDPEEKYTRPRLKQLLAANGE